MTEKKYKLAADEIKKARSMKGFSQEELADQIGTDQTHWSRWENGVNKPRKETLQEICRILDLDFNEIDKKYKKSRYEYEYPTLEENVDATYNQNSNQDELVLTLEAFAKTLKQSKLTQEDRIHILRPLAKMIQSEIDSATKE